MSATLAQVQVPLQSFPVHSNPIDAPAIKPDNHAAVGNRVSPPTPSRFTDGLATTSMSPDSLPFQGMVPDDVDFEGDFGGDISPLSSSEGDSSGANSASNSPPQLKSALSGGSGGSGGRSKDVSQGFKRTVSWSDMKGASLSTVVEYHPSEPPTCPRSDDPAWEPPTTKCACAIM